MDRSKLTKVPPTMYPHTTPAELDRLSLATTLRDYPNNRRAHVLRLMRCEAVCSCENWALTSPVLIDEREAVRNHQIHVFNQEEESKRTRYL